MKLNDRVYQELTHTERFLACMEAFARRDFAEVDRLNDTVKEITVREQNPAYFERLRGFQKIAMLHGIRARDLALGWFASLYKVTRNGLPPEELAESEAEEPASDADAEAFALITGKLKAHREAWGQFCADLGLDPESTDFAYYKESGDVAEAFLAELDRDEDHYGETLASLRQQWRERLDRVRSFGIGPELPERLTRKAS